VCPAGTSLDDIGKEVVETKGKLQLSGVTLANFERAKPVIIRTIQRKIFGEHGVWVDEDDIELDVSTSGRRALASSTDHFEIAFSIQLPINAPTENDVTLNSSSAPTLELDAAALSHLVMLSVQNENVTAFLNVSKAGLAVEEMPASLKQGRFKAGECPAGKYVAGGIGECTPCAPGRAALKGSSNCTDCKTGTYAAETGESTCKECPIGYYQAEKERTVCLQCRPQATTLDNGTSSVADCVCESSYFDCTNPAGPEVCKEGKCDKCPLSAECEQAGTLQSLIAEPGYWRAINSTTVFRPCPKLGQCGGGQIVNGSRDAQCAKGYVGVRCELCDYDSGYALHQPGESCSKCKPNEGRDTLILVLCAVVLVVLFAAITSYGCWPQKLTRLLRTRKVMIVKGKYAGRKGKLTKMKNGEKELDELHSATEALKHLYTQ
jgi:hypothetical protein